MGRLRALGGGSEAIGMDVDRGALKAVQLAKSGGNYILRHVGYRRLPPGTIIEGEVAAPDLLAAELKEFWSSHAFRGRSVLLGVANQRVIVRLLNFPRMAPEDLRSAIGFEAQDHIPMPLEEAVLDYVVLGPQEEGSELDRILVVAAHRGMIEGYTQAVRAGGLRPAGMDVKALSLTRSSLPDVFFDEGASVLLDVGTEITSLVVVQGGSPTLTRFIPLGLDDLVHSVAEAADLPEDEAERLALDPRNSLGLDPGEATERYAGNTGEGEFDPALVYDVRRGLEEAVQTLAEDVQRSIEYHHSQPGSMEVSEVLVSGEGALVGGFDAYLGEQLLGVPTRRANPLGKLDANRSNVSDEQLAAMEPVLSVAFGLAMEDE